MISLALTSLAVTHMKKKAPDYKPDGQIDSYLQQCQRTFFE